MTSLHAPVAASVTNQFNESQKQIHALAGAGLGYMKNTLLQSTITPADALERFLGKHPEDSSHRTELFCLVITMLEMSKQNIDNIGKDIYDKIFTQVVKEYEAAESEDEDEDGES